MIDPHVRPARAGDADQLRELERVSRAALVDARGGRRWLDEHALVGEDWAQAVDARHVVVGELAAAGVEMIVGYLVVDRDGELARIDQVFVLDEARQLGFGDALLAAAREWARLAGAALLEGEALPGDRDTKNLYERAGITARLIVVSTRLA